MSTGFDVYVVQVVRNASYTRVFKTRLAAIVAMVKLVYVANYSPDCVTFHYENIRNGFEYLGQYVEVED